MPSLPLLQKRPLMDHQDDFLYWCEINRVTHPACFMEMRLGKTLASIRLVVEQWRCKGACIVIAPVTVLEAWEHELFLEREDYVVASGLSFQKRTELAAECFMSEQRVWYLINYDAVRSTPGLSTMEWDVCILDECTYIKNPKSQISQLCTTGFRSVKHRMLLSGLPSPEGDLNLFQQFKFLHGQFMGFNNYYKFRSSYFSQDGMYAEWLPEGVNHQLIKKEVHRKAFIMRRQDAGIDGKKIREVRTVPMTKDQRETYIQVEKEFATWLDRGEEEILHETVYAIVRQMWLARIAGGCDSEGNYRWSPKVDELVSLLTGELDKEPTVVWFRFNSEIKEANKALRKSGIEARYLIGEMDRDERVATLKWFRESKNPRRALLCQVKLAKYGVDCSAADTAIYYSMTYSCEEVAQSEDRIFHPMKKSPLLYLYLTSRNSIDQDILYAVNSKVTNAKMFMMKINESILKRSLK